jgi:FkbM family methyltransferase
MSVLYSAVMKAGIEISKAAEIGVLSFEASNIKDFIEDGIVCDLYEAVPEFCSNIEANLSEYSNTKLNCYALSDFDGEIELCMAGPSTFNAAQVSSPAINHDGVKKEASEKIKVPCRNFGSIDPGDYDLVSIDIEGAEWSVIRNMKSRPAVLSIETQSRDYVNPELDKITGWLQENGYKVWVWDDTDTIFFRGSPPFVSLVNSVKSRIHNLQYFGMKL